MIYKFQPIILRIIREIIEDRKKNNMAPAFAIEQDILGKVISLTKGTLDAMKNDNVIGSHPNINQCKLYFINDKNGRELRSNLSEKGGIV